jgi:hypothetical protein
VAHSSLAPVGKFSLAIRGKADVHREGSDMPPLTQSGHAAVAFTGNRGGWQKEDFNRTRRFGRASLKLQARRPSTYRGNSVIKQMRTHCTSRVSATATTLGSPVIAGGVPSERVSDRLRPPPHALPGQVGPGLAEGGVGRLSAPEFRAAQPGAFADRCSSRG